MKKLLLILLLLINQSIYANWLSEIEFSEPLIGCVAVGGTMYYLSSEDDKMMGLGTGCLAGTITGYLVNKMYKNRIGYNYEAKHREQTAQIEALKELQAQYMKNGKAPVNIEVIRGTIQETNGVLRGGKTRYKFNYSGNDL
jgi:hypothetical protein